MSFKTLFYRLHRSGFFFILAVQIIFLFLIQPGYNWESLRYFTGGLNIKVYHPPLYNFYLSALYNTIPSIYAPILIQIIFYSFSVSFLIYALEKYFGGFSKRLKYTLLFIAAFEPLITLDNCTLSTESLFTSFTILNLAFFLFYLTERKNYFLILTGVSIGLSMATRFIGIIFPFFFIIMLFIFVKRSAVLKPLASIIVPILIFYFGICSLQYWKNGHFVYSSFGGWHLWNTASPLITPDTKVEDEELSQFLQSDYEKYTPEYAWDYYQFDATSQTIHYLKYLEKKGMSIDEIVYQMNWKLKEVAWKLIKENPVRYYKTVVKWNTKYFFDLRHIPERIEFPYVEKHAYISREEFADLMYRLYGYSHNFNRPFYVILKNPFIWMSYKIFLFCSNVFFIGLLIILSIKNISITYCSFIYPLFYFLFLFFNFPINLRFMTPITGMIFMLCWILILRKIFNGKINT